MPCHSTLSSSTSGFRKVFSDGGSLDNAGIMPTIIGTLVNVNYWKLENEPLMLPRMKCDEETELEMALSDIIEKEQAADLERKEKKQTLFPRRMKLTRHQLKKVG